MVPCTEDSSGQVVMALASFYFTASAWDKCWVWFDYSSTNVNFFKAIVSTLYEDVYHQVQPILIKLGNNVNTFIGDLDIWIVFLLLQCLPFFSEEQCGYLAAELVELAQWNNRAKKSFHNDCIKHYAASFLKFALFEKKNQEV